MRERNVYSLARYRPRMSWSTKNLFNLYQRARPESRKSDIVWRQTTKTLFQQRWLAKAVMRAYHGDHINEKIFQRWYLPQTLPDVRPKRAVLQEFTKADAERGKDDKALLEEFAQRRVKEKEYDELIEKKGLPPIANLMMAEVERRVDVFLFRCCFAQSVYDARRMVVHGYVTLNGKKHSNPNTRLAPGDMVHVDPSIMKFFRRPKAMSGWYDVNGFEDIYPEARTSNDTRVIQPKLKPIVSKEDKKSLTPFYLPPAVSPWLFVPAYIEVNFATCTGVYVRHPTARPGYSEIPSPYDADGEVVRSAWDWYSQRRFRVRGQKRARRMPDDRAFKGLDDVKGTARRRQLDIKVKEVISDMKRKEGKTSRGRRLRKVDLGINRPKIVPTTPEPESLRALRARLASNLSLGKSVLESTVEA